MEPFWYNDFTVLYDPGLITKFYPGKEMNIVEKFNASVRFAFYFSILLFLYKGTTSVFYIPIIALGITYYLWQKIPQ